MDRKLRRNATHGSVLSNDKRVFSLAKMAIHKANTHIRFLNKALDFVFAFTNNPPGQWKLLACLQAALSIWVVHDTQQDPSVTLLALVLWGGAAICLEDQLETLHLTPSRASMTAGSLVLVYATWRTFAVVDLDAIVFVLPFLQGFGLSLLARPIRKISGFADALIVLFLFSLQPIVTKLLPDYAVSVATGLVAQVVLYVFGVNSTLAGRVLAIDGGGVEILADCNGVDMIVQLTTIAVVFVLAFPIRSAIVRAAYVFVAPWLAFVVNSCRVAILAVVSGSSLSFKYEAFDFLHKEWGALVFAGIATMIMGQIYLILVEREIAKRSS